MRCQMWTDRCVEIIIEMERKSSCRHFKNRNAEAQWSENAMLVTSSTPVPQQIAQQGMELRTKQELSVKQCHQNYQRFS